MKTIKLENIDDFNSARTAVESEKAKLSPVVTKIKSTTDPDFTKPYTTYDEASFLIRADDFVLKVLSEASIDYESLESFSNWGERFDAIASLKKLVAESPILVDLGGGEVVPLQSMIETWYTSKSTQISDFIKSGDSAFYNSIQSADDFWWDIEREEGTVREQAISAVEGLII